MSAVGTYLTDGTVTWIIEDATQADAVGDITLHSVLLPGHILADGSEVAAEDFPRLVSWVFEHDMLGDDAAHYAYNSETKKLRLPNAMGRVLQAEPKLAIKEAGLPNIKGHIAPWVTTFERVGKSASGVFQAIDDSNIANGFFCDGRTASYGYSFDASRASPLYGASDTVQPRAITMLPQIKY